MLAFFDDQQLEHEPGFFLSSGSRRPNPEVAERATVLKEILIQHGHELKTPESHGMEPVAAIHTPAYLHFWEKQGKSFIGQCNNFLLRTKTGVERGDFV